MNNLVTYTLFKRVFDEAGRQAELCCEQEPVPSNRSLSGIAKGSTVEDLIDHYRSNGDHLKAGDVIRTISSEVRSVGVYTDYPVYIEERKTFENLFLKKSRE